MQHSNDVTLRLVREISNENQPLSQVALHDQLTDILIEGAKLETTIKVADNRYILFLTDVRKNYETRFTCRSMLDASRLQPQPKPNSAGESS